MTVRKSKDAPPGKQATAGASSQQGSRKPWKKKTPVQILLDQVDKLKEEIREDEESLKEKKEQLRKFEEASKLFESK